MREGNAPDAKLQQLSTQLVLNKTVRYPPSPRPPGGHGAPLRLRSGVQTGPRWGARSEDRGACG
eukprot:2283302-Prymnesium_polylepis.1